MSDLVFVAMDERQARSIEEIGKDMLRRQDPRATTLLTVFLAWKLAAEQADTFSRRVEADERTFVVHEGGAA